MVVFNVQFCGLLLAPVGVVVATARAYHGWDFMVLSIGAPHKGPLQDGGDEVGDRLL
jgi:hypothetical protein